MASAAGPTYPRAGAGGLAESLSIHDSAEKLDSSTVNRVLMEFLSYFGRAVFVFYPVYLTGYLGLSISWVLLCMVMATWWKKNRQVKDARIGTAINFVDNETQEVNRELQSGLQMATWVRIRVLTWDADVYPFTAHVCVSCLAQGHFGSHRQQRDRTWQLPSGEVQPSDVETVSAVVFWESLH